MIKKKEKLAKLSSLGKHFEKQFETIEDRGREQVEALKVLKPNTQQFTIKDEMPIDKLSGEAKELNKIKEIEKTTKRENAVYRTNEYIYGF